MNNTTDTKIDNLLIQFEPLIYYHIHKMRLWHQFPAYRDDMVQEGRMGVLRAYNEYKDKPNFVAYVHSTVRNAIYDYVFKDMQLQQYAKNIPYLEGASSWEDDTTSEMDILVDFMRANKDYDMLYDYFIEGQTQAEVAKTFDVSQQWVSSVVNKFREDLKEFYFDPN